MINAAEKDGKEVSGAPMAADGSVSWKSARRRPRQTNNEPDPWERAMQGPKAVSRLLRYVQGWVDRRTGRPRYRFRRRGFPKVKLPGVPGSAEFMAAYQMAMATAAAPIGIKRNAPGSVAYVVAAYLDWQSISVDRTGHASDPARHPRALPRGARQSAFATMPPKFIVWLLDQKRPHVARNWLKALRALTRFAVALDFRKDDPARDIKLARTR